MAEVEVKRKELLTREEAARKLSTLAAALADGEHLEVAMGSSTVRMHAPAHVRCEVEVEVDHDEIELEIEFKWSTAAPEPGQQ